ncbi:MAG: S1-like domain-containing RNA-binding protein [Desulfuromonadales bacterium]|nr:S1-like domain-containing RNA-binding protein [Desulfuromonadales bacterium]
MLEFGRINRLKVQAIDEDGAWLQSGRQQALLPKREVTEAISPGDTLDAFVYADASGHPVATLRKPKAEVGEFAVMRASQINVHGAFMDWGLAKDLLVPRKEQAEPMKPGRSYLVKVRLDREGRPIGTARIDKCLCSADETIGDGQEVDLLVWQFTELGAKVIINHRFGGLLYRDEIGDRLNFGDHLKGYIRQIRPDGKIDCTLNLGTRDDRDDAKQRIMNALLDNQGFLPLHDKSPSEQIQETLGLSKKLFKKGVGGLYKADLVELTGEGIRLKEKS